MSTVAITMDIVKLKEPEMLQYIQNTIGTFSEVVLSVNTMRRDTSWACIKFIDGEYVDYSASKQDEDLDTIFDLLGLPVQLLEGYRKITVKTTYQYGFIHSDYHAKINKNLTQNLPVYILTPPKAPATNVRVEEVGRISHLSVASEPPAITLIGYTSGEVNESAESKELWFKPTSLELSSIIIGFTGFLLIKADSDDDNLVTGIILT